MTVYSPAVEEYNFNNVYITVQGYNFVVFTVKACRNAHVALSEVRTAVL